MFCQDCYSLTRQQAVDRLTLLVLEALIETVIGAGLQSVKMVRGGVVVDPAVGVGVSIISNIFNGDGGVETVAQTLTNI